MRQSDAYLLDMLVAARKAASYVQGLDYERFLQSDLHQDAVIRALEIVGEGASRIDEAIKKAHPEIPWAAIVGFRNRIVHAYFQIDLAVVWKIVKDDVLPLVCQLEQIVPPESE